MLKIGITGGIGSGKSIVSKLFILFGIPVFDADRAAKYLMENEPALKEALQREFGKEVFENGRLNRSFLASFVFQNSEQLERLNRLVHPFVINFAREWIRQQDAPYIVKEAALFFETGTSKEMDKMVGVASPEPLRLKRAMHRDQLSEPEVRARMSRQMDEAEKMKRCDYIIYNDESQSLIEQVRYLHHVFSAPTQKMIQNGTCSK